MTALIIFIIKQINYLWSLKTRCLDVFRILGSRILQDIIMRADAAEKIAVFMNLKGESVKHVDTGLPSVFMALHLLDPQGWMLNVLDKKPYLFREKLLNMRGKLQEVLFKRFGPFNPHALRSARNSSTVEKDFTLPAAISASASSSAFSQSKRAKYGGSVRAYFISSRMAALSSVICACFLKSAISLRNSSGISRVILWAVFTPHLLLLIKIITIEYSIAMEISTWA